MVGGGRVFLGARVGSALPLKERQDTMGRSLVPRYLAALELSSMSDAETRQLAADVAQAAKTSQVVLASAAAQASVAAVAINDGAFAAANQAVAADQARLHIDIGVAALARYALVGELRTFASIVTSGAQSYADVQGAGLRPAAPRTPRNTPPTVPTVIHNRAPRTGHGKTTVTVEDPGPGRHQFAAQESRDGGVTWTQLGVGYGKTRVVTGASGAQVWVRFAMVRGRLVSDYCTPVIVTIP